MIVCVGLGQHLAAFVVRKARRLAKRIDDRNCGPSCIVKKLRNAARFIGMCARIGTDVHQIFAGCSIRINDTNLVSIGVILKTCDKSVGICFRDDIVISVV